MRLDADQVIARGSCRDAPGAGKIAREHGADGLQAGMAAERGAEIDRFECQHLSARGQLDLDLRHRRTGPRRHDKLGRFIERDAAQPRRRDGDVGGTPAGRHRAWCRRPGSRREFSARGAAKACSAVPSRQPASGGRATRVSSLSSLGRTSRLVDREDLAGVQQPIGIDPGSARTLKPVTQ